MTDGSPTSPSGITWADAEVTRTDKGWQAVVDQPAAEGAFVSLRVTAADADGNAVTQTVVRAYGARRAGSSGDSAGSVTPDRHGVRDARRAGLA